ncbi:MAG: oxidoreductase [Anaerolineae bacterium]
MADHPLNSLLFSPITIGNLTLRNRLMRSATAERLVDPSNGAPTLRLTEMYTALAQGGVGTIVAGHAFVAFSGRCHDEMNSMADDVLIPTWRAVIAPAQQAGARVIAQLNHGGASCDPAVTPLTLSPSGIRTNASAPSRALLENEIYEIIAAFGQAALRAREAGFDGIQLHGAHGYLASQFLMPRTNLRSDAWGGDARRRRAFLLAVIAEARRQVGADYPVWLKLGVVGSEEDGISLEEGAATAAACLEAGIDCLEISNALGAPAQATREEPSYLALAHAVRNAVSADKVLALVNGFRTRPAMEAALASGLVQLVSLCRPLIANPALPRRLAEDPAGQVECTRCGKCWPEKRGDGISCKNKRVQEAVNAQAAS